MKALRVTKNAAPSEALAVEEVDAPEPGPGQLRIRVAAASLNFNDIDRCRGNVTSIPMPPPFTLGMDVCGVVEAAGDAAGASWIGRRVMAITAMAQGGIEEGFRSRRVTLEERDLDVEWIGFGVLMVLAVGGDGRFRRFRIAQREVSARIGEVHARRHVRVLYEEGANLRRRQRAHELGDRLTVTEQSYGGQGADAVRARERRLGFGVHLGEDDLTAEVAHDRFDDGGERLARTAPAGPEVHQHRALMRRFDHRRLELRGADVDDQFRIGQGGLQASLHARCRGSSSTAQITQQTRRNGVSSVTWTGRSSGESCCMKRTVKR